MEKISERCVRSKFERGTQEKRAGEMADQE